MVKMRYDETKLRKAVLLEAAELVEAQGCEKCAAVLRKHAERDARDDEITDCVEDLIE